jgi:hypothetical protein
MSRRDLAPLTGVLFVALIAASFVALGESPGPDASAREVVAFYAANHTGQVVVAILTALSALPLLFFTATLRERIAGVLGRGSLLAGMAFGAGVLAAVGFVAAAAVHWALADAAGTLEPTAVQALNAVDGSMFIVFSLGIVTLVLATAVAGLRSGLLPAWLGWSGVAVFAGYLTPAGFFGFIVAGLWIAVAGGLLSARDGTGVQGASARLGASTAGAS